MGPYKGNTDIYKQPTGMATIKTCDCVSKFNSFLEIWVEQICFKIQIWSRIRTFKFELIKMHCQLGAVICNLKIFCTNTQAISFFILQEEPWRRNVCSISCYQVHFFPNSFLRIYTLGTRLNQQHFEDHTLHIVVGV